MLKSIVRHQFLSKNEKLTFEKYDGQCINYENIDNLYIHIPFCQNLCPYCPYFKSKYSSGQAEKIEKSILSEIDLHLKNLEGKKITSLYIGGGTPTLMSDTLRKSINLLESVCTIDKIAIETNPQDINEKVLDELEDMGCNLLSLGIQDFNQKYLELLKRNYDVKTAINAIKLSKERNFETINIDLIFSFPGQTLEELDASLKRAIQCQADQITLYPLFTFPYSSIGKVKSLKKVKLPNSRKRKKYYYHIYETLKANGYKQISVWGFLKNGKRKYSSVTRDYYLGFGPSAATYTGEQFLFNSFSLEEYSKQIANKNYPYSIIMPVSEELKKLFWLYWRFYETIIPLDTYEEMFSSDFNEDFRKLIKLINILGYSKKLEDKIYLSKKGIHKIHLVQNHFALNYINRIWTQSSENPETREIKLEK